MINKFSKKWLLFIISALSARIVPADIGLAAEALRDDNIFSSSTQALSALFFLVLAVASFIFALKEKEHSGDCHNKSGS